MKLSTVLVTGPTGRLLQMTGWPQQSDNDDFHLGLFIMLNKVILTHNNSFFIYYN